LCGVGKNTEILDEKLKNSLTFPPPQFFSIDAELLRVSIFHHPGTRKKFLNPLGKKCINLYFLALLLKRGDATLFSNACLGKHHQRKTPLISFYEADSHWLLKNHVRFLTGSLGFETQAFEI
jgi:hypothetical protein